MSQISIPWKRRIHSILSVAVLIVLLGALYSPSPGLAEEGIDPLIRLSSANAPPCSGDGTASCISWFFKSEISQTVPFLFDCNGNNIRLPLLRLLVLLFGIKIPPYVPLPLIDVPLCNFAIGSTFEISENPPLGSSDEVVKKTYKYVGAKVEDEISVKKNYTYTLTLNAHGRDFRNFFERNHIGTFATFVELSYQELDPNDDSCQNALDFGLPYSGNLEFSGDHDWQRIKSLHTGTMVLTLDVPPDKDYQMEVRSDDCMTPPLGVSENGTGMDEQIVMPVESVYYRVHIYGKTPEDFGAWYSVSAAWDLDDNEWGTAKDFTLPIDYGNLEYSGDHDWQRINVPEGGGSLVLEVPAGRNYDFELWRDDVKVQLAASKSENGLDEHIPLTQGGWYRIHTYGVDPATDFGAPYRVYFAPKITIPTLDIFDRANGPLGSNWLGYKSAYRIRGDRVEVRRDGPIYWKDAFGVNQQVTVTLTTVDPAGLEQDLLLKVQGQYGPNWGEGVIEVFYNAKENNVRVTTFRLDTLQWFEYPPIAVTFADGDQFGAQALENGDVLIYKNGLRVGRITLNDTDRIFFNSRGGHIGLWFINARNAFFDNFSGGDVPMP